MFIAAVSIDDILSILGPLITFFFLYANCITVYGIISKQSVSSLSPIPFGSLFVSNFYWSMYVFYYLYCSYYYILDMGGC